MRNAGASTAASTAAASDGDTLWQGTAGATGTASASVNNDKSSAKFDFASTESERWVLPKLNYGGTAGIDVVIYWSGISSGAADEGVRFDIGHGFVNAGGALADNTEVSVTVDVSAYTADDLVETTLATIAHGDIDADADLITCTLRRDHDHADDDYGHDIYVHAIKWKQASA